jgi:hypothetical protein
MRTETLVRAFEDATVDPKTFGHRQHLYVAWCYLRELPLEEALARFVAHLRRLTTAHGAPEKYHATITWTYLVALNDAMTEHPELGFDELLLACPELLDHRGGVLAAHYDREELASPRARQRFVLPRRATVA